MRPSRRTAAAVCVVIGLALSACTPTPPDGAVQIESAYLVLGKARPEGAMVGGRRVGLPDYWTYPRRRVGTEGWYRMKVELEKPTRPLGLMLLGARLNVEVFWNGTSLGRVGRFEEPIARNPRTPLYYRVLDVLVRKGSNEITVHLATTPGFPGYLEPIWLAPDEDLQPVFARAQLIESQGSRSALFLAWLLALLLFGEALFRRPDRMANFYLGCVAMAMGLSGAGYFVTETPIPSRAWEWGIGCLTHWASVLLVLSAHRFLGISRPSLERWLVGVFVAMSVVFATVPETLALTVWMAWLTGTVGIYLYLLLLLVRGVRRGELNPAVPIVAFLAMAPWVGRTTQGVMFAVAALAWFLLARTYRRLRQTAELQVLVAAREKQVKESYDKLRELERGRVVAKERERLMRDMHDGTGGQLASALAVARSKGSPEAVAAILQEALDDLRLTIESLDPGARDVPSVLGMMRATLGRRLEPAGLRLVWRVGEAGGDVDLEPEEALHLIRIVQEAVTNTIKHARAEKVTIATRPRDGGGFVVEVRDDGCGGSAHLDGGRGLGNMRSRAEAMGGRVELTASDEGTTVTLFVPG